MSRRDKERTKKLNFLEFFQDIYLEIVVTYLLAHIAWKKIHKMDPIQWHKHFISILLLCPGVTHITFYTRITPLLITDPPPTSSTRLLNFSKDLKKYI